MYCQIYKSLVESEQETKEKTEDVVDAQDEYESEVSTNVVDFGESASRSSSESGDYVVLTGEADPELLEIFIEEAGQVCQELKENWNAWLSAQQSWEHFTEMRRGFHTLKGSGRFAGTQLLGEFAWTLENLCNKLINKKATVSTEVRDLIQRAIDSTPPLISQLSDPKEPSGVNTEELMSEATRLADLPVPKVGERKNKVGR